MGISNILQATLTPSFNSKVILKKSKKITAQPSYHFVFIIFTN